MSSIFVIDGMKRTAFSVKIDVESSTQADLFREVAKSYTLELDPIKNLRITFAGKELKYRRNIKLQKVGIINDSTIGVIIQLPDRHPTAPATTTEDADVVESVEAEKDGKHKDAEEVSLDIESVPADEEHKEVKDVPAAESMPVKAKKKTKKKKRKDAIIQEIPMVEDAFDSLSVTTDDKENKEADDATAAESEPVKAKRKRIRNKRKPEKEEEIRPVLQNLPQILTLTFEPDFLDFDKTVCRARLQCSHVMGSETMRAYCQNLIDTGSTIFPCPYKVFPASTGSLFALSPSNCPAVWEYRHVRHVACFTTTEMQRTEKTIAINFMGLESSILTCPGCFTWCSKADAKQTRLRCFACTREHGMEFLFCGYCLSKWRNTRSGRCANAECKSIEATLDILRNSPKMDLFGAESPTTRLCPRCGILTEFMGGCSQVHCQVCGHYYCFLCLKGAKSKAQLQCKPYKSFCQRAAVQTAIPEWDGCYIE